MSLIIVGVHDKSTWPSGVCICVFCVHIKLVHKNNFKL